MYQSLMHAQTKDRFEPSFTHITFHVLDSATATLIVHSVFCFYKHQGYHCTKIQLTYHLKTNFYVSKIITDNQSNIFLVQSKY